MRQTEYQTLRRVLKAVDEDGSSQLKRNVGRALERELTDRQREMVYLYYVRQMRMRDIAERLDVNVSTVSRTIARGRKNLRRCLRYGSQTLINLDDDC